MRQVAGLECPVFHLIFVFGFDFHTVGKRNLEGHFIVPDRFLFPIGLHAVERHAAQIVRRIVFIDDLDVHLRSEICRQIDIVLHQIQKAHSVFHIRKLNICKLEIGRAEEFGFLLFSDPHEPKIGFRIIGATS